MSRRLAWLVLVFFAVGGCGAHVAYIPLVSPQRPLYARAPAQVERYVVTPPARPHVDVGMVQVISGAGEQTIDEMLDMLRVEAGQRGCDAIVITMIDTRRAKYSPVSVEGSCEVYTDAAGVPPPNPPVPPPAAALPLIPEGGSAERSGSALRTSSQ